jgi:two-component system nitrogen regulation sensor histidine kinase NtrY
VGRALSASADSRGGSIRRRLLAAFAVVAVPPVLVLAGLVLVLLSRSFERTATARLEDGLDAVEGRLARMAAVAAVKVAAVAKEDLPVAGDADLPGLAAEAGERRDLEMLEVVRADGTIVSSLHWPVGFGLLEQDRVFPGTPRFRMEKVSEGYGDAERLAVVAQTTGSLRGQPVIVRGGFFIQGELLDELSRLMGAAVAVRDEASGRWIAEGSSPLATWAAPPQTDKGEVVLRGESYRWRARALAPGLALVVAIPRSAIVEVMGGVGRSTLAAAIVALLGALLAASLLSERIASPVRARFERMTAELAASRERVIQAERVAAWREMARRLAHELKNPIFPIQLSIETLRRVAEEDSSGRRLADLFRDASLTILDELRALRKIIDEFSQFARMPAPQPAPLRVNEVVEQALRLYAPRGGGVEVRTDLGADLPLVEGDRDLLARALGNLLGNALDALDGTGRLTLRTARHAGGVRIDVEDTGPGLSDEQRTRLFTPYYTTKRGGTGLGLAIVQGIVSDHGGRVEVASAPGQGTAFTLFLPGDNAGGSP